jgi:hypothetical protein
MPVDFNDEFGNQFASGSGAADGSGGFGAAARRFITAGVLNGDFAQAPETVDAIDDWQNPLPYWSFVQASGRSIQAWSVVDALAASGNSIQLRMTAGAASDDAYLEQIVPVNGARGQSFAYHPFAGMLTGATVSAALIYMDCQFLKSDGVTTTGTAGTGSLTTTSIGVNIYHDVHVQPNVTTAVPSDAYYLRIRIGFKRDVAATSTVETVTLTEARLGVGPGEIMVVEGSAPGTYGYGTMYQTGGGLVLAPNQAGVSGYAPTLILSGSSGLISVLAANDNGVQLTTFSGQPPWLDFIERTAPASPPANQARLYCRDNGAGKTQLVVLFPTGAVQVLATEP